jgi:carboxyl-terminal processing protease
MNNKKSYILPVLLMSFLAIGILLGTLLGKDGISVTENTSNYSKMQDIIRVIDAEYVDSVQADKLFEQSISDMLHKLDPHSNYIPASELKSVNEQIEGKFGGVGVRFAIIRDTLCITNVVPGSPSERAGIQAGDRVLMINNKLVAGKKMKNEAYMGMLKGDPNTSVSVQIYRGKKRYAKTIRRDFIPISSIVCAQMINHEVGYIRLDQFSVSSAAEFHDAAVRLKAKGMKKLIFDLRDNGGGVLSGAVQIVDEFLPAGRSIVEIRGKKQPNRPYRSQAGGVLEQMPLVLIINENSASASEIVAGALQDNDRATIIGRRSFGKGLVQQDFILQDKSNLRLTIARYYTPSGRCIQKPFGHGYEDYYEDQLTREKNGEFFKPDSTRLKNAKAYKTLKGRTVYDGGGIMPDVFVPLDTSNSTLYYVALRYSPAFQHYAFDFVAQKRGMWKSIQAFNAQFEPTKAMITGLTQYAAKTFEIPVNNPQLAKSYLLIQRALKSEIARQLFIEEGYFFVQSYSDNEIQKALQLLKR